MFFAKFEFFMSLYKHTSFRTQFVILVSKTSKASKIMQQNGPVVRGDDLGDSEWLTNGGTDTLHHLGKKCSDMDKNKGKIPPHRRSTNSSSSSGGFDNWFHVSPPLDPCLMKFPPVDGNGNPVLPIRRAPGGGVNAQSGGGAAANTSTAVIQSDAGK